MFIANITHDDIISQEGSLELYLGDLPDWENKIVNAKNIVLTKIKSAGKKLRLLNKPLYFYDPNEDYLITNTAAFTSETTSEDNVERMRFVIEVTELASGSLSVKVQGSDDETTWTNVCVFATDQAGEFSRRISKPFKYYRLVLSATGSRTFTAYMVEDVFFLPVLYKTISMIFLALQSEANSNWSAKYQEYDNLFNEAFESLVFSYDANDDEEITSEEENSSKRITILR